MGDPRQSLLSNPWYLGPSGTRRNSPWFKDYVSARFDNKPFDPTPYLAQIQAAAAKLPYGQDQVNRPLPVEPAPGSYATWGDAIRTRLGGERPVSPWAGREAEIAAKVGTQGIIPYGADQANRPLPVAPAGRYPTLRDAWAARPRPAPAAPAATALPAAATPAASAPPATPAVPASTPGTDIGKYWTKGPDPGYGPNPEKLPPGVKRL